MRPSCLFCVTKHISQANILIMEVLKGYPSHLWVAVGHLGEAEDESLAEQPILSGNIRKVRLALTGQEGKFERNSVMEILSQVRKIAEKINGTPDDIRNRNIVLGIEELTEVLGSAEEIRKLLRKGDPVKVRDTNYAEWGKGLFIRFNDNDDIRVVFGKQIDNYQKNKPYNTQVFSYYKLV